MVYALLRDGGDTLLLGGEGEEGAGRFFYVTIDKLTQSFGYERFNPVNTLVGEHGLKAVDASRLKDIGLYLEVFGNDGYAIERVTGSSQRDRIDVIQNEGVTIDAGAGNDYVKTGKGDDFVGLGLGNDSSNILAARTSWPVARDWIRSK